MGVVDLKDWLFIFAVMDVFFILLSYIGMSFIMRFQITRDDPEEINPIWIKVEHFIKKYHVIKFLYALAIVLIINADLQIISDTISNESMSLVEKVGQINALLVGNAIAFVFAIFSSETSFFQNKTEEIEG